MILGLTCVKLASQLWQQISYLPPNRLANKQPLEWQTLKQVKPHADACCNLLKKPSDSSGGASKLTLSNLITVHILSCACVAIQLLQVVLYSCYYDYKYHYFCTWRFKSMDVTRIPGLLLNGLFRIGRW